MNWRRGVLLAALLLIVLFAGYKALRVRGLVRSVQHRLDELQAATSDSGDAELHDVRASLQAAHADLNALRSEVAPLMPLFPLLGWVPGIEGDLRAIPDLLDLALSVTDAGMIAFDAVEPLVDMTDSGDFEGQPLARVMEILSDARPELEAAQAQLALAQDRRSEIDDSALSTRTADLVAQLDRYLPLMQVALDGGRVLPDLFDPAGRQTFLILAQNNDELRATGGFISAVGLLTLQGGEIVDILFEDSYDVDDFSHPYPDSPAPVLRYMGIDQWVFRDANWSPDFPTAAQRAIELYRISRDLEVDGVLAVDQHLLQAVVAALGSLEVEGWPEPLTAENVIPLIRLAWSPDEVENWSGFDRAWWEQRKSFIGDLVGALQAKIETAPDDVNWLALARMILNVLDERHLQIWLTDPAQAASSLLAERGWDGALRPATSDYLMVVDTNMGYNKANAIVQESLEYRVLVSADGTAQGGLTVRHHNPSDSETACDPRPRYGDDYDDLINRCYWVYLRAYVPSGSQLAAVTPHPIPAALTVTGQAQSGEGEILPEEKGKAVYGSFFVVPKGETIETQFVYQLPRSALVRTDTGWRYRLLVQKQAGTDAIPMRVTLNLPPGAAILSAAVSDGVHGASEIHQPAPDTAVFDVTLDTDRVFDVRFQLQ